MADPASVEASLPTIIGVIATLQAPIVGLLVWIVKKGEARKEKHDSAQTTCLSSIDKNLAVMAQAEVARARARQEDKLAIKEEFNQVNKLIGDAAKEIRRLAKAIRRGHSCPFSDIDADRFRRGLDVLLKYAERQAPVPRRPSKEG